MSPAVIMNRIAEASPRLKARIAGVLSLISLLAAVFGEFIGLKSQGISSRFWVT